jgi:hypothetical protein
MASTTAHHGATLSDDLSSAFRAGQLAEGLPIDMHHVGLLVNPGATLRTAPTPPPYSTSSTNNWGPVLHDDDLAQAIIDRVHERSRLV